MQKRINRNPKCMIGIYTLNLSGPRKTCLTSIGSKLRHVHHDGPTNLGEKGGVVERILEWPPKEIGSGISNTEMIITITKKER